MHSSGMHTTRLVTVSQHAMHRGEYPSMHWAGGFVSQHALDRGVFAGEYLPGSVCPGGCLPGGCLPLVPRGCVSQHAMGQTPPCGQTDTCENITFANFVCGR